MSTLPVLLICAHFSGKQVGRKTRATCTCFGINPPHYSNFAILLVTGHEEMLYIAPVSFCRSLSSSRHPTLKLPFKLCHAIQRQLIRVQTTGKGKAVPLQAWSGPEGSRKLRFTDFVTTAQDGGKVVSLTHRPPLPPGNAPGTHLC